MFKNQKKYTVLFIPRHYCINILKVAELTSVKGNKNGLSRVKLELFSGYVDTQTSTAFLMFFRKNFLITFLFQNWLAFESLHRPLFKEHRNISFANDASLSKRYNFAFCQVSDLGEEKGVWEFVLRYLLKCRKNRS